MAETTIQDAIERSAKDGVASVSVDGTSVTAMSIEKQIAADNYLRQRAAAARNHLGLTFRKIQPGGCG